MAKEYMSQVKIACSIAKAKYDSSKHTIVFMFDQSNCYKKFDEKYSLYGIFSEGWCLTLSVTLHWQDGLRYIMVNPVIVFSQMKAGFLDPIKDYPPEVLCVCVCVVLMLRVESVK